MASGQEVISTAPAAGPASLHLRIHFPAGCTSPRPPVPGISTAPLHMPQTRTSKHNFRLPASLLFLYRASCSLGAGHHLRRAPPPGDRPEFFFQPGAFSGLGSVPWTSFIPASERPEAGWTITDFLVGGVKMGQIWTEENEPPSSNSGQKILFFILHNWQFWVPFVQFFFLVPRV